MGNPKAPAYIEGRATAVQPELRNVEVDVREVNVEGECLLCERCGQRRGYRRRRTSNSFATRSDNPTHTSFVARGSRNTVLGAKNGERGAQCRRRA